MAESPIYLTKERLIEIENELKHLKTVGREEMAQRIAEARSYGDLSENAEYDAAKEAQGLHELKISKLENILARAVIIDLSKLPNDEVHILSKVTVKNKKNNKTYVYTLVSEEEAEFQQGKISITSPVGKALLGKKINDVVTVKAPAGLIEYEILNIENI
ncbi:MAG TPA: transcription elongation factor GreA [Ignavibacteriales bacterium]|nr:transcription elongation factor GreA [Ignavibacteriales bacterium]